MSSSSIRATAFGVHSATRLHQAIRSELSNQWPLEIRIYMAAFVALAVVLAGAMWRADANHVAMSARDMGSLVFRAAAMPASSNIGSKVRSRSQPPRC